METIKLFLKKPVMVLMLFSSCVYLMSCEDDGEEINNSISESEEQLVASEAEIDALYEDVDDMTTTGLASTENSGGKTAEEEDDRFCEGSFNFSGDKSSGVITVDFGDGCVDRYGNTRKGKIIIEYTGGRLMPGSVVHTTLENYSINDISVEGMRTLTNIADSTDDYPTFHITLQGGKVIWPDETFATREVDRVRVWVNAPNPFNDEQHVTGTASGKTREEVAYNMEIIDTLVYKRSCRISRRALLPVQGIKVIKTETDSTAQTITIDYGEGGCDRAVDITTEGRSEEVTVG